MTDKPRRSRSAAADAPRVFPEPGEPWRWPTADDPVGGPIDLGVPGPRADLGDPDAGLPRDENGRVPAYYRCTPEEIEAFGLTPPPLRRRHDQWTPAKMAEFIDALGATGTVSGACALVGACRMSAYRLRNRADASAFRAAWDEALRAVTAILADTAHERALEGVKEDVWYKGEKVGVRTRYNDRLLMFLLRVRDPHGYAPVDQLDRALRRKALPGDGAFAHALSAVAPAEEAWGLTLAPGGEAPAVARLTAPPTPPSAAAALAAPLAAPEPGPAAPALEKPPHV